MRASAGNRFEEEGKRRRKWRCSQPGGSEETWMGLEGGRNKRRSVPGMGVGRLMQVFPMVDCLMGPFLMFGCLMQVFLVFDCLTRTWLVLGCLMRAFLMGVHSMQTCRVFDRSMGSFLMSRC